MSYVQAGPLIKALREHRGITQEMLADGIMERTNLSRLERGEYRISKVLLDDLLNRLGYMDSKFFNFALSNNEYKTYSLRDRLREAISHNDITQTGAVLAEIEQNPDFHKGPHKQFLLNSKAAFSLMKGDDPAIAQSLLDEAIRITIPNFKEDHIEKYLLTSEDIEIINEMAEVHFVNGKLDDAIALLKVLVQNIKHNYVDEKEKAYSLSLVLYNLSKYMGLNEMYQEALDVCDEAIKIGKQHNVFGMLPMLIFNKAYCLLYLKKDENIKDLLYQAYYGCRMMGLLIDAKMIQEYANDLFQIVIEDEKTL